MPQSIVIGAGAVWVLVLAHQYSGQPSLAGGRQSNRNTLGIQGASGCRIKHLKWPLSPDLPVYKKEQLRRGQKTVKGRANLRRDYAKGSRQLNLQ